MVSMTPPMSAANYSSTTVTSGFATVYALATFPPDAVTVAPLYKTATVTYATIGSSEYARTETQLYGAVIGQTNAEAELMTTGPIPRKCLFVNVFFLELTEPFVQLRLGCSTITARQKPTAMSTNTINMVDTA